MEKSEWQKTPLLPNYFQDSGSDLAYCLTEISLFDKINYVSAEKISEIILINSVNKSNDLVPEYFHRLFLKHL